MPAPHRPAALTGGALLAAVLLAASSGTAGAAPAAPASDPQHHDAAPRVSSEPFGELPDGTAVERWTLSAGDIVVKVITYGGIVQTLEVPDEHGDSANVVLGFEDLAGYVDGNNPGPYFGAVIGRYGNRIAGGAFALDGTTYQLPLNDGPNTLHGGPEGFDRRVWTATAVDTGDGSVGVRLERTSPDGEEGFPGALATAVTYTVDEHERLSVHYEATTDAPTVVNLTQHTYWNLAGEGSGDVYDQEMRINASRFVPVDDVLIPTGELADVEGTPFDFREATPIGERIRTADEQVLRGQGYDHNWVLDRSGEGAREGSDGEDPLEEAAVMSDPASGRTLTISTTEPGLQFYSGNFLDGTLTGTGGGTYRQGDGVALETQHFPDSPNQDGFPSTELRPGEVYESTTVFDLGVR